MQGPVGKGIGISRYAVFAAYEHQQNIAPAPAPTKNLSKIRCPLKPTFCLSPLPKQSTSVRYAILPALLILFLFAGCKREFGGTRLFEITYAPQDLVIPAGLVAPNSWVGSAEPIQTGFMQALADNNLSMEDVDLIGGLRARVTTLDGNDFNDIGRIQIRICPQGQQLGCDQLQNIFTWDNVGGARQQSLNLNPTPLNFRELFFSRESFRFEIAFTPFTSTNTPIELRLEWAIQAVGDLD